MISKLMKHELKLQHNAVYSLHLKRTWKNSGMWKHIHNCTEWSKPALSVCTWCCHHVLFLNRLFREQTLNKAIHHAEEHRLTLSGRDPHCETCGTPARTPQCPVLPTSSIPSPRETKRSSFAAEHIKACIVLLANPECISPSELSVLLYRCQRSRVPIVRECVVQWT